MIYVYKDPYFQDLNNVRRKLKFEIASALAGSSFVGCHSNKMSQTHLDPFDLSFLFLADADEVVSGSDTGERRPPEEFSSSSETKIHSMQLC